MSHFMGKHLSVLLKFILLKIFGNHFVFCCNVWHST